MPPDQGRLDAFVGKILNDMGAVATGAMVLIGDRLGLYKALAEGGPLTPAELASLTGTAERYVREWLAAQAAAGYVEYRPETGKYAMTAEQVLVLADDTSPAFMAGGFEVLASMFKDEPKISEAFHSGRGVGWHEHSPCLFRGTERFFRTGYAAHLVQEWLPALTGLLEKLERGAKVADVGCGHGASSILMAQAFPNSSFTGFDFHGPSVERARVAAREAGIEERCRFEVADAKSYPGNDYDLVAFFDCLHDMGDPVGAAQHVRQSLGADGTWLIVEPYASDTIEGNLTPVGRIYYAASTMICVPASLSQDGALALGAQAGEALLRQVVMAGGFTRFRRATATPFNLVLEARP
ncbi:MAG TPA: class I SAM-dependent methyltransferase [Pirellulales bacterium]|jgi:SAM-dependent methyltransferase|nr:class I SAM-dependent methyltransferase [Pirellulales bacterium]